MKTILALAVALSAVVWTVGCKKDAAAPDAGPASARVAKAGIGKAAGAWDMILPQEILDQVKKDGKPTPSGTLTITGDGKFDLKLSREGSSFSAEGTAKVEGNKLFLTATMLDGKAPETEADKKPQELVISEDGMTANAADGSMSFKKKA